MSLYFSKCGEDAEKLDHSHIADRNTKMVPPLWPPTYDFKTIEKIFGNHRLLSHLDSRLRGTCPAFI